MEYEEYSSLAGVNVDNGSSKMAVQRHYENIKALMDRHIDC
jgi:hypothetical protein